MADELRKVMIATPSYDSKVDAWYCNAMVETAKLGLINGINFTHVVIANDALIQRARNDLAKIAAEGDFESVIWVDGDVYWNPEWALELANRPEDIVGGTYRKKTDTAEMYAVNIDDLTIYENGLMKANSLGTGFVKVSAKAHKEVFNSSKPYKNAGGKDSHMVFDIAIVDGELMSEDTIYFEKLKKLGYEVWLDPKMTLSHLGSKKYDGDFANFAKRVQEASRQPLMTAH